MATLADLVVNLNADTRKFDKGIDKAKGGLKSFEAVASGVGIAVKASFVAVTGGIVALGGAVYGLTGRIGSLASIADRAAQTGLSGAFLQRLEYAADQSGVSVETLETGMKKLLMQMGKNGETISLSDKLTQISAEMQGANSAAERASIGVKHFGKAGVEMTGLFAGGVSDLNKLLTEAQRLGIGVDDESLARAAKADDAIQRMKFSFGALVDQVAIGMAPAFESAADKATELLVPITEMITKFNQMENRWTWLKDIMVAAFGLGLEKIKANWKTMLRDLADQSIAFGKDLPGYLVGMGRGDIKQGRRNADGTVETVNPVQDAQTRFDTLLAQFKNQPGAQPAPEQLAKPKEQPDLMTALAPIGDKLGGMFATVQAEAKGLFDGGMNQASSWLDMFSKWLGPDAEQAPKQKDPQLASVAAKGSAEAMRTINFSNLRGKDPVLNATQQQTVAIKQGNNQIVQAIKDNALGMLGGWG